MPKKTDSVELEKRTRQLEEKIRRQNEYMAAFQETALSIMSRLDAGDLFQTLVVRATNLAAVPDGFIYIYDAEKDEFELRAAIGSLSDQIGRRFMTGRGLAGAVWKTKKTVLIDDYQTWPERSPNPDYHKRRATVAIQLKTGGEPAGVIGLAHHDPNLTIEPETVKILEQFAELASIALDNAILHTKLQLELSERRRLEEEREKIDQQVRQSQKLEAIGTLAGGIAHDFNNLLMSIQGNTSLVLLDKDQSHPDYRRLMKIEEVIQRGADLTKQLLGFAGEGRNEVRPTNINLLIDKTSRMFERTRKEITIIHELEKNVSMVDADQGQLKQVILNLLVNAWQAMPKGGEIQVKTENKQLSDDEGKSVELSAGNYVKIAISDSGIGMDEVVQERIFDPFFTTKHRRARGTGLGLASAFGIIKTHGGHIQVSSVKGEGSTFSIYLPVSQTLFDAMHKTMESDKPQKGEGTILLIDDEDMVVDSVEPMLKELGYTVITAQTGSSAIQLFTDNKDRIDIVILDMILPEVSGEEIYAKLKETNPDTKILLSSGYSQNGKASELLDRGCDGFIQKPFNIYSLSQKLREILDRI